MPKIKNIRVWSENLHNTKPYTIAFKTIDTVCNVFVELTLDNGIMGMGSGNPSEKVVGESLTRSLLALENTHIEFLMGRDIREIHLLTYEIGQKFPANPSAGAALEIALYDAFTKYLDVPLVQYLGQKIKTLPVSVTLGIMDTATTLKEAEEYKKIGFFVLKIKLGLDVEEDVERITKLYEKFSDYFTVRIDANQGYSTAQTMQFYTKTKHLGIELIEQPLPVSQTDEMRQFPDDLKSKLVVDESLLSPKDALKLIKPPRAADIFNIKLMKCGGISTALQIAAMALYDGIELFWGCNDESRISITAALHTAFSCPHTRYIDLDGSFDLAKDIVKGGFILKDGFMSCTDRPGLGTEYL